MQKLPAQLTAVDTAGLPSPGGSSSDHFVPFQNQPSVSWSGSWDTVQVPTAMQFVVLPQDRPEIPHGPGAVPEQKSEICFTLCHDVPFQTENAEPASLMHRVRLAQVTPGSPADGAAIFRHEVPFQVRAPVGPPAMQNVSDEHDTAPRPVPGGFFSVRHPEPVQIAASECLVWSVVVYPPTAMHQLWLRHDTEDNCDVPPNDAAAWPGPAACAAGLR